MRPFVLFLATAGCIETTADVTVQPEPGDVYLIELGMPTLQADRAITHNALEGEVPDNSGVEEAWSLEQSENESASVHFGQILALDDGAFAFVLDDQVLVGDATDTEWML